MKMTIFEESFIDINELFDTRSNYSFLLGAGISIDSPSNLLSAKKMIEIIIDLFCPESEYKKILQLKNLRFELVIEIIKDVYDSNLKLMNYFDFIDLPNLIHYFAAYSISKNYNTITSNFDYLIELALKEIVDESKICLIITRNDYSKIKDINLIIKKGYFPLLKIHGSKKNIIENADTTESLITTISSFGKERPEGITFSVEEYKQIVFNNMLKDRILVVMGYSGSDDFDIIPSLKKVKNLLKIIWINHEHKREGMNYRIFHIKNDLNLYEYKDKDLKNIEKVLGDLKAGFQIQGENVEIYKIDVNTSDFISQILWAHMLPDVNQPRIEATSGRRRDFRDWLISIFKIRDNFQKFYTAYLIYYNLSQFRDAVNCLNKILSNSTNSLQSQVLCLINLATIRHIQGFNKEALNHFYKALHISNQLKNLSRKATILNSIGEIYRKLGKNFRAIRKLKKSLNIYNSSEELRNNQGRAYCLNNLGLLYKTRGDFNIALDYYQNAINIFEHFGNLLGKSMVLNNIGELYRVQGSFNIALEKFNEASKIDELLGDIPGLTNRLNNIASIYLDQNLIEEAYQLYNTSYSLNTDNPSAMLRSLQGLGGYFFKKGKYIEALGFYNEGLFLSRQIQEITMSKSFLMNIGEVYHSLRFYQIALNFYEQALDVADFIDDYISLPGIYNMIGILQIERKNYLLADVAFKEACRILTKTPQPLILSMVLNSIGRLKFETQGIEDAKRYLNEALEVFEQLNIPLGKATALNNLGILCMEAENFAEANNYFLRGIQIIRDCNGQSTSIGKELKNNISDITQLLNKRRSKKNE